MEEDWWLQGVGSGKGLGGFGGVAMAMEGGYGGLELGPLGFCNEKMMKIWRKNGAY